MLSDVLVSGVVFTRDIYTLAPYYTINYNVGKDTTVITSGSSDKDNVHILYKEADIERKCTSEDEINLIKSVKELELFFENDALDIEFGITCNHVVYIFQVRPITRRTNIDSVKKNTDSPALSSTLESISKKIEKLQRPHPFLAGNTTYFGVIPDWNPAEILGVRPARLAISLYKELITDNIWALQRDNYGYRNLSGNPLMVLFCGIPYIDTRITFNSFIPNEISEYLTEKLVNYYLRRLKEQPAYHDKIEFEIVFSCYYFGLSDDLRKLKEYGFNENECKRIEFALLNLTNHVIDADRGLYKDDLKKIEILKERHRDIIASELSTVDKIYWLIEVCKRYGTLPFAGVARAAFIAVQFLKSLVSSSMISKEQFDEFMITINTISKQMGHDRKNLQSGALSKEEFLEKYGHIRPGTYDILSPRYDEDFEGYFGEMINKQDISETSEERTIKKNIFSQEQMKNISIQLEQNGLNVDAERMFDFIREAIEGREYAKFVFTKTVSEILRQIEKYGKRLGIRKLDIAHLDISLIKNLYVDPRSSKVSDIFLSNIKINREQYELAEIIKLPELILSPDEVYSFKLFEEEPNFVTTESVKGSVVTEADITSKNLEGKIVFIKSADSGYDYLFTKKIGGLITQFGGANSHMAIRCAEMGIPAVIGAGEKNYNEWSSNDFLLLDAKEKQVKSFQI